MIIVPTEPAAGVANPPAPLNVGRIVLMGLMGLALIVAGGVVVALRSWRATEAVVQVVVAPDSTHVARVFSVAGPGKSGRHYLVLRLGRLDPRRRGQAVDDSGAFWLENATSLAVRWTAPRRLTVEFPTHAVIDGRRTRVGVVQVTYLPVDAAQLARDQQSFLAPLTDTARGPAPGRPANAPAGASGGGQRPTTPSPPTPR